MDKNMHKEFAFYKYRGKSIFCSRKEIVTSLETDLKKSKTLSAAREAMKSNIKAWKKRLTRKDIKEGPCHCTIDVGD